MDVLAKAKTSLESNLGWLGFTPDFYSINPAYIDAELVAACKEIKTELIIGNCNDYNEIKRISARSEEHTSEIQSLMRISYAVFCLKKKTKPNKTQTISN